MPPVPITIQEIMFEQDYYHRTYDVTIDGVAIRTTVTRSTAIADDWIRETDSATADIRSNIVVGFDIESRQASTPSRQTPVSIIQFCVENRCLIFQIGQQRYRRGDDFESDEYEELQRFVGEGGYTFVGVNVDSHCEELLNDYELDVWNRVDLGDVYVAQRGDENEEDSDLFGLANRVLGMEITKPGEVVRSNWNRKWLTLDQVKWAVTDAYVAYRVGMSLEAYRY